MNAAEQLEAAAELTVPVSVIIPVHNRPALLRRAVESIQRQRVAPAEVIVVDDCSSDETATVAQELGVTLISHDRNLGAAAARNTGLATARHDWVALLDSDDEWLPHMLETLWPLRDGHVVVSGAALGCWDGDRTRPNRFAGPASGKVTVLASPTDLMPDNVIPNSGTLVRRSDALAVGGYDPRLRYAEDWDLMLRVLERGTAVMTPTVVSVYHRHEEQKSIHSTGPAEDHERILKACAERDWWSPKLLEHRRGIRLWDELTDGLADGRRMQALPLLARMVSRPHRVLAVARLLARRWRLRRSGARVEADGRESLALLPGPGWHRERARRMSDGRHLRELPRSTVGALIALARRPAGVAFASAPYQAWAAQLVGTPSRRTDDRTASRRTDHPAAEASVSSETAVAYITTHYPAISLAFIRGEIEALRRRGVRIITTSVRRARPEHLISAADRQAFTETLALVPPRWSWVLRAHVRAVVRHPRSLAGMLRLAIKLGRPGWRGRVWALFYSVEAVTAWDLWRARGVKHVHAHFAAVPADVAMLAAHLGRRAGAGPSSWGFTMHGPTELSDVRWFRLADKVRHADVVVCISEFARSQLMALVEERHWSKLQIIRCGVEPHVYAGVGDPPGGRPRILCVGRLVPEKGQRQLLSVIAMLASRGLDTELELVGDGPERRSLERRSDELGIADRVSFAGAVAHEELIERYAACTVFCSPSFAEGVPVVLMEAMASRRAVVATAIAGVRELVRDGQTGVLVSPGAVSELADAVEQVIVDAGLRRRLAEQGAQHVAAYYDVERSADQLHGLFNERLAGALSR